MIGVGTQIRPNWDEKKNPNWDLVDPIQAQGSNTSQLGQIINASTYYLWRVMNFLVVTIFVFILLWIGVKCSDCGCTDFVVEDSDEDMDVDLTVHEHPTLRQHELNLANYLDMHNLYSLNDWIRDDGNCGIDSLLLIPFSENGPSTEHDWFTNRVSLGAGFRMQLAEVLREENGDNLIPGQDVTFNQLPYSDDGSSETWEDFCTRMSEAEGNTIVSPLRCCRFILFLVAYTISTDDIIGVLEYAEAPVLAAAAVLLNRQINVVTSTLTGVTHSSYFPSGNANLPPITLGQLNHTDVQHFFPLHQRPTIFLLDNISTHQPDLQSLSALDMNLVMATCLTQFLREPASIRQRKNWAEYVSGLSELEFRRTFRMSWPDWEVLLHHFSGRLDKSFKRKVKNDFVIPDIMLAMTIRFLAGGAHQDIYGHYGVGCSTFYDNLWLSMDAIDSIAEFAICFPYDDASQLRDMEAGWAARSTEFAVRGCVAALDGIIVKTVKPPRFLEFRDANGLDKRIRIQQARYWQPRKCCYGLNVQVMCDAKCRITYIFIKAPASSHDSLAFHLSALGQILKKHGLPAPYFIVADNAYVCSDWLVVPFKGAKEGSIEDTVNFCRMHVWDFHEAMGHFLATACLPI